MDIIYLYGPSDPKICDYLLLTYYANEMKNNTLSYKNLYTILTFVMAGLFFFCYPIGYFRE